MQGYPDDPNRNIKTIVQECSILYLYPSVKFTLGLNRIGEAEGKIRHFKTAPNIVSPTTVTEGMSSHLLGQVGRIYSLLGAVFFSLDLLKT